MEFADQDNNRRDDVRRNKYKVGRTTENSGGYNIIRGGYEVSRQGAQLQAAEGERYNRDNLRQQNIDINENCGYNPVTGVPRLAVAITPGSPHQEGGINSLAGKAVRDQTRFLYGQLSPTN